jgi:hypothetical protein
LYIKKIDQTDGRKRNKIATPYLEEGNPRCRILLSSYSSCNIITTKNNNESNNKILYQKKTRKKSWTMWRYIREARP